MSANDCTVRIAGLWKKYCKSLKRSALYTLADAVQGAVGRAPHTERLRKEEFWALQDISLELRRGDCLGVIGPNGAGKSTLLKLISGMIEPDRGRVEVAGRVGALIQVGAGFHPQLTGRENVYVNGTILGMSRREIKRKFDAIVEFADIGEFLDSPVKFYSSGMLVRLGFAIAVHTEPDVLLIDEVLAVGDVEFKRKCYRRMQDIASGGRAVLLVSHNMDTINQFCTRGILLESGRVAKAGDTVDVVRDYLRQNAESSRTLAEFPEDPEERFQVLSISVRDRNGRPISGSIEAPEAFDIWLTLKVSEELPNGYGTIVLRNEQGEIVFLSDNRDCSESVSLIERGVHELRVRCPAPLLVPGRYTVTPAISTFPGGALDYRRDAVSFDIIEAAGKRTSRAGHFYVPLEWVRR